MFLRNDSALFYPFYLRELFASRNTDIRSWVKKVKFACLIFRCLNGSSPPYLSDLISCYPSSRELHSGDKNLLICKPFRLILFGKRAFSCAAPLLWNSLLDPVRQAPNLNTFRSLVIRHLLSKNCN
jgi:hypothetical protein